MTFSLVVVAVVLTLAAAIRSTWSPCGWSMLSTITPLTERSRHHRFGATAAWFVAGATLGGVALGALGAIWAVAVGVIDPSATVRLVIGALMCAAAAACDLGRLGAALPHHRRQVNEQWLDEFRPWVYAAGFGAQIGAGLATYIMTASVYLVVGFGALTGNPVVAVALGALFGAVRGAAVLAGRGNDSPRRLAAFHRRFDALTAPVRRAVISAEVAAAAASAVAALLDSGPATAGAAVVVFVVAQRVQIGAIDTPPSARLSTGTRADRRETEPTTA